MDYIKLSVIGSLIGTISIVLVYIYLYFLYRERHIGMWALSWLFLLSRYVIFDSGMFAWKQSVVGLTIYQILIFASILLFVGGTYLFANKPLKKFWLYGTLIIAFLSFIMNVTSLPLLCKLFIPILFGSFVCFWIGITFIRFLKLQGIGSLVTGYAYIMWGAVNLVMPFTINIAWFAPWGYSIGGILRFVIAIGTLMVYFEKTRNDLIKKEAQYRLLAENAVDVIYYFQISPVKKLNYLSPSVLAVTGYSAEEYYADLSLIFKLIHPDDQSLLKNFIDNPSRPDELPLTLRLVCKDNNVIWVEQKCMPIPDKNGKVIALEGIVRDITVRKNLEEMASMFERMNLIGNMAATVAHEIRNPMTTVRGYLQILQRRNIYKNDRDKFILMIEEIDRANSIIQEYLSLSRTKLSDLQKCSLNNITETLFPLIQASATSANICASIDLADIPDLLLDKNEIRQLLLNLARNGIEAMPLGGNLTIRTFIQEDKVVLAVSDQGSGIPQHVLDHLGTPFITTKATGTGLGLPICYQIAQRHNAKIEIDTGTGGTTFFICFKKIG